MGTSEAFQKDIVLKVRAPDAQSEVPQLKTGGYLLSWIQPDTNEDLLTTLQEKKMTVIGTVFLSALCVHLSWQDLSWVHARWLYKLMPTGFPAHFIRRACQHSGLASRISPRCSGFSSREVTFCWKSSQTFKSARRLSERDPSCLSLIHI